MVTNNRRVRGARKVPYFVSAYVHSQNDSEINLKIEVKYHSYQGGFNPAANVRCVIFFRKASVGYTTTDADGKADYKIDIPSDVYGDVEIWVEAQGRGNQTYEFTTRLTKTAPAPVPVVVVTPPAKLVVTPERGTISSSKSFEVRAGIQNTINSSDLKGGIIFKFSIPMDVYDGVTGAELLKGGKDLIADVEAPRWFRMNYSNKKALIATMEIKAEGVHGCITKTLEFSL